jgi:hypothetical protein
MSDDESPTRRLSRMMSAVGVSKTPVDQAQAELVRILLRELAQARRDCDTIPPWLDQRLTDAVTEEGRFHLLKIRQSGYDEARGAPCRHCERDARVCRGCGSVIP